MENYFNYFTEIEEHFQQRRGTTLLLSTLDWALVETWKDAGIPMEAVLRGIDATFDKYDRRPSKTRKVNSLAYCAQEVLAAAEEMKEAAVGARPQASQAALGRDELTGYLRRNRAQLEARAPQLPPTAQTIAHQAAQTLEELAREIEQARAPSLEDLERRLTVLEEKLFAALVAAAADSELLAVRAEADRDLAPFRRKLTAPQIEQLHKQYVYKRLLERAGLPRLSLFYL